MFNIKPNIQTNCCLKQKWTNIQGASGQSLELPCRRNTKFVKDAPDTAHYETYGFLSPLQFLTNEAGGETRMSFPLSVILW